MKKNFGLTLIELLIVVSLLAVFLSLGTIVFTNFARKDEIDSAAKKIVSAFSEARAKTLAGFSSGGESGLNFGIHFESQAYTLFSGTTFNPDHPDNQESVLPLRLMIGEISLPSGNVVFSRITGDVHSFDPLQNSVTLSDQKSDQEKVISINKMGVVTVE